MPQTMAFGEILEVVEQLPPEDQEALIDVVQRRLAERGRKRVIAEAQQARKEFEEGKCRLVTVDELMKEIES